MTSSPFRAHQPPLFFSSIFPRALPWAVDFRDVHDNDHVGLLDHFRLACVVRLAEGVRCSKYSPYDSGQPHILFMFLLLPTSRFRLSLPQGGDSMKALFARLVYLLLFSSSLSGPSRCRIPPLNDPDSYSHGVVPLPYGGSITVPRVMKRSCQSIITPSSFFGV